MKLLTPQEALQALIDGKKVECLIKGSKIWCNVLLFRTDALVNTNNKFRLAQEMITVNGVNFPKPESEPPKQESEYYIPDLLSVNLHIRTRWDDDLMDGFRLGRGLVHLTKENAIAHAKALIKLSGGKVDE